MNSGLSTEDTYLQLKALPESSLSPQEFLVVAVYEMTSPYIRDYKSAKREILNIQEDLEKKHGKVDGLMDSVEKLEFEARRMKQDAGRDADKFDLERQVLLNQKDVLDKEVLLMQNQLTSLSKANV